MSISNIINSGCLATPNLTSSQIFAIPNPVNGYIVTASDNGLIYFFINGNWYNIPTTRPPTQYNQFLFQGYLNETETLLNGVITNIGSVSGMNADIALGPLELAIDGYSVLVTQAGIYMVTAQVTIQDLNNFTTGELSIALVANGVQITVAGFINGSIIGLLDNQVFNLSAIVEMVADDTIYLTAYQNSANLAPLGITGGTSGFYTLGGFTTGIQVRWIADL